MSARVHFQPWHLKTQSPQGQLDQQFDEALKRFNDKQVPKLDYWGGYKITPIRIEFWKGRSNRMHNRMAVPRKHLAAP